MTAHKREELAAPSFDETFSSEIAPLYRYLRRRVGPHVAEDLASATFAIAFEKWEDVDSSRPVRPWLYGIATNLMRHHWRHERRMLRAYARTGVDPAAVASAADEPASNAVAPSQHRELAAAIASLRPQDREILLLHAWADLGDGEIARALSISVGTVKSRLHRARSRLRNQLGSIGQSG